MDTLCPEPGPARSAWSRRNHHHRLRDEIVAALWQQPLWAIPFALIFGTLYGPRLALYWVCYKISLVFAFVIRAAIAVNWMFVLPALQRRIGRGRRLPLAIEAPAYALASLIGSYAAAGIIHFTLVRGFLGTTHAVLTSGVYASIFTVMFSGIAYAIVFHREALAQAQAVERMRAELAEAELRTLRAQINPHFLFNTLNAIASLIRENPDAAEDTTTQLADVFRYALRSSAEEHARLADELAFLRAYLAIERTRFGPRLRVEEAIEPGVESLQVPSLLLQPLVENAVRYCVAPRAEGGTIRIAARRDGATAIIEIADDGPGMNDSPPSGTGFGLHSVRERLRAAGPPHALAIASAPGTGTRITITLPFTTPSPSLLPSASLTKGLPS